MKHTIKTAIILMALCMPLSMFAQDVPIDDATAGSNPYAGQSVLTFKNNTDDDILVSFVYFDPIDECWVSRGWRKVPANGGINHIDFGVYTGNVYIHGYSAEHKYGHGYWFCCENKAPFRVLHANSASNCEMRREYTRVPITTGNNVHEFNR